MPELPAAQVDYKEAKTLVDLTLIFQDLEFTAEVLQRLRQLLKNKSQDRVVMLGLWTTALISYVRCFSSGKRFGLSENIFKNQKLKGNPIGCHRYYKHLRDKHIAHSVNPFEQVAVDIQLSEPDSGKRKVIGVGVLGLKLAFGNIQDVENLMGLTLIAKEEVRKQAKEYKDRTLEVAKSLPIETLYSKARSRIIVPGPEDAGKARKQ